MVAMAAVCLLFVLRRDEYKRNFGITLLIGAYAYAIASPFLSPSLIKAIRAAASNSVEGQWSMGTPTGIAMIVVGWLILWRYLPRWTSDWRLQFFVLFAYLTSSVPILLDYFHRQFLPQPKRYKTEMEFALSLLLVFGLRYWFGKASPALKTALILLILALAGEQVVKNRRYAKTLIVPADVTRTIEYRTAVWLEQNLGGVRVMLPGSIAQWANDFTGLQQFSGSSWSAAASQIQQRGMSAIYFGGDTPELDAGVSLAWLKAFRRRRHCRFRPHSQEFWKPFAHPTKFDGVLPVLWREDDVTIYRVSQRTTSLAHIVPEQAIVNRTPARPSDIAGMKAYVAALDVGGLPAATFAWQGRNRIHIAAGAGPGQAVSIQVSYEPGWHARVNGHKTEVKRDGLGLMWLLPHCNGSCDVQLEYTGGWELWILRVASYTAIVALLGYFVIALRLRIRPRDRA